MKIGLTGNEGKTMLTCKEAAFLASKAMDGKLTWRERLGFWLHVSICRLCRRYTRDFMKLRILLKRLDQQDKAPLSEEAKLSESARDRIRRALDEAANRHDDT
ncbi:MAG: anti-sigma factor family protein [Gammaproteobacteria bacterium]